MPCTKSHTLQIISRQRVADHGEVFTSEREAEAMCDLVKNETERIESRFLEPACGQGAFLIEILRRKLAVVSSRYAAAQSEWERHAAIAVSSLYGIDMKSQKWRVASSESEKRCCTIRGGSSSGISIPATFSSISEICVPRSSLICSCRSEIV